METKGSIPRCPYCDGCNFEICRLKASGKFITAFVCVECGMGIQRANDGEECPVEMYKEFKKAALEHKKKHFDHWRIPMGDMCERCPHCEKMSYFVMHASGGPGHITFFACKGCGMTFHYRGKERKSAKEMHVQYQIAARKYSARKVVQREEPIRGAEDPGRSAICGLRRPD